MPRQSRTAETRNAVTRNASARRMPQTHYKSKLYIPPEIIPKDKVYKWVRISTLNEPDPNNWAEKNSNNWQPVPRDRHPELYPSIPIPGMADQQHKFITNGGLMLCEKPKKEVQQDYAELRRENLDAIRSVKWTGQGHDLEGAPKEDFGSDVGFERVTAEPTKFKE
jgi:hypothetical protein